MTGRRRNPELEELREVYLASCVSVLREVTAWLGDRKPGEDASTRHLRGAVVRAHADYAEYKRVRDKEADRLRAIAEE